MSRPNPYHQGQGWSWILIPIGAGLVVLIPLLWWGLFLATQPAPPPPRGATASTAEKPPDADGPPFQAPQPDDPVAAQGERLKSSSSDEHEQAIAELKRRWPAAKEAALELRSEMRQYGTGRNRFPGSGAANPWEAGKALIAVDPEGAPSALVDDLLDVGGISRGSGDWSKFEEVRYPYFDLLAEIGPPAVPALIAAFKDPRYEAFAARGGPVLPPGNDRQREADADWAKVAGFGALFARIGPACVPALRAALKDDDARTRQGAAFALGNMGPAAADVAAELLELLHDPDDDVRAAAAYALTGRAADETGRVVPALVDVLGRTAAEMAKPGDHQRASQRWSFVTALLGEIGPGAESAVAPLVEVGKSTGNRWAVAETFATMGSAARAAAPTLVEWLRDGSPLYDSAEEMEALQLIGPAAREAVGPALLRLVKDDDRPAVRWRAFLALAAIDRDAAVEACPSLRGAAEALDLDAVRALNRGRKHCESLNVGLHGVPLEKVGRALDALGPDAADATPLLLGAWQTAGQSGGVSGPALNALGRIGPAAGAAAPALAAHAGDPAVREVLVRLGEGAAPALGQALTDRKDPNRRNVLPVLGEMGAKAKAAVPALGASLKDDDEEVRRLAAEALGRIGPDAKEAVPALREALKDKSETVRRQAAETLGRVGPDARAAVPDLIRLFADETMFAANPETGEQRSVAVRAASRIGKDAVDPLLAALADDNPRVRAGAAEALGRIGPDAHRAVTLLLRLEDDPREPAEVRNAAKEARKRLDPD
jgi:HEAT repeat protein